MFSRLWMLRFWYSGLWHHEVLCVDPSLSVENSATTIIVEVCGKRAWTNYVRRREDRDDAYWEPRGNQTEVSPAREKWSHGMVKNSPFVSGWKQIWHCHIVDGLSDTRKRERRERSLSLPPERKGCFSQFRFKNLYCPCCQAQDALSPPLITNEHYPSHPTYITWSQSYPLNPTLKMVIACSSETSLFTFKTKQCHSPEHYVPNAVALTIIRRNVKLALCSVN